MKTSEKSDLFHLSRVFYKLLYLQYLLARQGPLLYTLPMTTANIALKNFLSRALAVMVCLSALAVADITTDLVGRWSFENNPNDSGPSNNNGTAMGSPSYTNGTNGYALLSTTNKYVDLGSGTGLNVSNQFTVAAWIHWSGSTLHQNTIISRFTAAPNGMLFNVNDVTGYIRFYVNGVSVITASAIPANTWTHVAGVYNGANAIIYVNAVSSATGAQTGNLVLSGNMLIGARADNVSTYPFTGRLDEVCFFRRALTAAEIGDLRTATLTQPSPLTNIFLFGQVSTLRGSPLAGVLIWQSNISGASGAYSLGDGSFTLPMPQFTNVTITLTAPKGTQVPTTSTNIVTPTTNFVMNFTSPAAAEATTFRAPSLYSPSQGDLQVEVQRNTDAGERVILNLVSATGNTKWRLSDTTLTGKANLLTVPGNSLMRLLTTGTYILEMKIVPTSGFEDDPRNQMVRKILIVGR